MSFVKTDIYIPDFFASILNYLRKYNDITSIVSNKVYTNNTFDLKNGDYVKIGVYDNIRINNVVTNVSFDAITNENISNQLIFYSKKPYYLYGNNQQIANKLIEKDNSAHYRFQKYPLFALVTPIEKNYETSEVSNIDFTANIKIYILDLIDFQKWANIPESQWSEVIKKYLESYKIDFITKLRSSSYIQNNDFTYTETLHYNFGVQNNTKNMYNNNLAGYELNMNLAFYKLYNCS